MVYIVYPEKDRKHVKFSMRDCIILKSACYCTLCGVIVESWNVKGGGVYITETEGSMVFERPEGPGLYQYLVDFFFH